MNKEEEAMKLLKIDRNEGQFLDGKSKFAPIDKITKEDLLRLVGLTLENEAEFDEYDEDTIKNPAHQILYSSIYEKLSDLKDRKAEFTDESERLYLPAYTKYQEELLQQDDEGDSGDPKAP